MKTTPQQIETDPVKLLGHVLYEVQMMLLGMHLAKATSPLPGEHALKFNSGIAVADPLITTNAQAFRNLGIEATLVHYRALEYFVCNRTNPKHKATDLVAENLVPGFGINLPMGDCERIHKEVCHLTKQRTHEYLEKGWDILSYTSSVRASLLVFLGKINSDDRYKEQHQRVKEVFADLREFELMEKRPQTNRFQGNQWTATTANPKIHLSSSQDVTDLP